jgi:hypothetical protein
MTNKLSKTVKLIVPILLIILVCSWWYGNSRFSSKVRDHQFQTRKYHSLDNSEKISTGHEILTASETEMPNQQLLDNLKKILEVNEFACVSNDQPSSVWDEDMGTFSDLEQLVCKIMEMDKLRQLYHRDSHDIKELPLPTEPTSLHVKHYKTDVGVSRQKRSTITIDYPFGTSMGFLLSKTERMCGMDEGDSCAKFREKTKTLTSFIVRDDRLTEEGINIEMEREYILLTNNNIEAVSGELRESNAVGNVKWFHNLYSMLQFPEVPMKIGEEYEIPVSVPKDIPNEYIRDASSSLKVKLLKRVMFDRHEANLVQAEQINYMKSERVDGELLRVDKTFVKAQYYVDVETGKILWAEFNAEILDSTISRFIGTAIRLREELSIAEGY